MIVIFGGLSDIVEAYVCQCLLSKNLDFLLLDARYYPDKFDLDYYLKDGSIEGFIRYGSQKLALKDIRSIYIRNITKPSWSLQTLINTIPTLVINRSFASATNGSKPYQKQVIMQNGFKVPCTLVTTNPQEALNFYEEHHQKVIYKSVSSVRSIVKPMKSSDLERLELISNCPTQFQEFVTGVDIRVHVIGERVFAAEINSDATDYRYAQKNDNRMIKGIELPEEVAQNCINLTKALGLVIGGVDLRRSFSGEYYCFEVNPNPAFTFYESYTHLQIGDALAELLAQGLSTGEKQELLMPKEQQKVDKTPFISDELRPKVGGKINEYSPIEPSASKQEIQERINELMGQKKRKQLGIAQEPVSPEMWKNVFQKNPQVECQILGGEAVLLNLENGNYYSLNRIGTVIWESFNNENSLEKILDNICQRFEVDKEVAQADLITIVTELNQKGLIKNGK